MIVQCDQCNTRFKLDDAKITVNGVKVRCSKCKHVFVAKKEAPQEEADLDSLLNGLGAETPPLPSKAAKSDANPPSRPVAADEPKVAISAPTPQAPDEFDLEMDDLKPSQPAKPVATPTTPSTQPSTEEFDLSSFSFGEEPTSEPSATSRTPLPHDEFDAGAFNFAEQPPPAEAFKTPLPSATIDEFDSGAFTFGEETLPTEPDSISAPQSAATAQPGTIGDGASEFNFEEEPLLSSPAPAIENLLQGGAEDGLFSFAADAQENTISSAENMLKADEGSIDFTPAPPVEQVVGQQKAKAAEEAEPMFASDFSMSDQDEGLFADIAAEPSFGNDSTSLSSAPQANIPSAAEAVKPVKAGGEMEPLDFGDLDFGDSTAAAQPEAAWEGAKVKTATAAAGATIAAAMAVATTQALRKDIPDSAGATPIPEAADDLPPLSIASRRKGASVLPVALTAVAAAIILVLAGIGFYLFKGDQATTKLGFISGLFGKGQKDMEMITINNPVAEFVANKEAGELFVVSGEATNNFKKARASIQVKVALFGPKGEVLQQKTAYCGNALSKEQLSTLPLAKIDAAMNNQFGDSLANLNVQPGKGIKFVVVFSAPPKGAAEFGIEVAGSTMASQ